jgi:thioredoxin-dependent peroxiredoxin
MNDRSILQNSEENAMAQITFKGNPIQTAGSLPAVGSTAPDFNFVTVDLTSKSLHEFAGIKIILNIFPSLDTSVCATSVRKFNVEAAKLQKTMVLCLSKDLPFAHTRFCTTEGIQNVVFGSEYRDSSFSDAYGVRIMSGPLEGLFSRAVVVLDQKGKVVYTEQVPEITQEPDYEKALAAAK